MNSVCVSQELGRRVLFKVVNTCVGPDGPLRMDDFRVELKIQSAHSVNTNFKEHSRYIKHTWGLMATRNVCGRIGNRSIDDNAKKGT